MKKIILLTLLLCLTQMLLAQGTIQFGGGSVVNLNINFSPLPGSAGTNQPSGSASYSQTPITFLLQFPASIGDLFYASINLGTNQATDGWIYEKEDDGSFLPVMELTNEITFLTPVYTGINIFTNINIIANTNTIFTVSQYPETLQTVGIYPQSFITNYYYAQDCPLTVDQLQSLVEGKWYAEVDYGDDKYLGNLTPTYIEQPAANIEVSPTTVFPSGIVTDPFLNQIGEVVVAPANNRPATVRLNGSGSDPFGFPLQYRWLAGPDILADTTAITDEWRPGTYQISLEASDGYSTGSEALILQVITPEEAVNDIGLMVEQSYPNTRAARALTPILAQAQNSFARRDTLTGAEMLADFQDQVRRQMTPTDSTTATWLIQASQDIIDAVGGEPDRYQW